MGLPLKGDGPGRTAPTLALALAAALACMALGLPKLVALWSTGRFFDTDDALRMAQLRDLLDGQGWSDLVQYRLNAPDGLPMHWSRVIDAPLAAMISFFEALSSDATAERLTRLVWPAGLLTAWFAALIHAARTVNEGRGGVAAVLIGLGMVATLGQFEPGRIDHHGAQILLLTIMAGAALSALETGRAGAAGIAGAAAALSLAISVENMPFIAALGFGLTLLMVADPERDRAPALWFALSLCGAAYPLFLATVPAAALFRTACDAYSIFHLSAAMAGGATILLLALLGPALRSVALRLVVAGATGGLCLFALRANFPACFGDPLASVDPLLRLLWLSNVAEARPLVELILKRPDLGLPVALPLLLGFACAASAALRCASAERRRWLLVALLIGAGGAATLWQVRAASSTLALVVLPASWTALAVARRVAELRPLAQLLPAAAALPFMSLFWTALLPGPAAAERTEGPGDPAACFEPAAFATLAAQPVGIVLSTIDSGSAILAHTAHSVLAGPYHRNNQGNLLAVNTLLAAPDRARTLALASGAKFVAICPQMVDLAIYAEHAPDSLAALLKRGEAPDWLVPIPDGQGPWKLYRIREEPAGRRRNS